MATAISLFAALGVGSVIAALIARWNSVSQLRQAWVDSLRREIAEFFHSIEEISAAHSDPSLQSKFRERRDNALLSYRRVILRLNTAEPEHRLLSKRLKALLSIRAAADLDAVDSAMAAAKQVLKAEWERTKFGPFYPSMRKVKRRARLRKLRKRRRP